MPKAKHQGRAPLAEKSTNRPGDSQHTAKNASKSLARYLNEFVQELDDEVESRCDELQEMAQSAIQELREMLTKLQLQLPSMTKTMLLTEYRELNTDPAQPMHAVEERFALGESGMGPSTTRKSSRTAPSEGQAGPRASTPGCRTTRKGARELAGLAIERQVAPETGGRATRSRATSSQVLATPMGCRIAAGSQSAATPGTARLPRPNEPVFSQNLSPFGNFQNGAITPLPPQRNAVATPMYTAQGTVGRAARGQGSDASTQASEMAININLEDGRSLQITSAEDIEALEEHLRPLAHDRLRAMKEWTENLTALLGGTSEQR